MKLIGTGLVSQMQMINMLVLTVSATKTESKQVLIKLHVCYMYSFTIETGKVVKSSFEIQSRVIDFLYHVIKFFYTT